ncbi:nuclease-related domain-containing protein [Sporolactobacillus nakayamae]|uniref:Nuclease-related domain-containing protein n=1 Tax=Sporolactobacillus nakayamae TaxID=269670 RepID=A0A1I2T752_9BACL|nr:nuclease-related domain-containing protein [Sporolactobacillus nakayamae]SFG60763.1 Nuclease-related domain-containing protein [Sporolactobacillus nakayamae]
MFIKPIQLPYHIRQYEALTHRLKADSTCDYVLSQYKRLMAGYRGEQSLDFALSYLSDKDFRIFHNLRLYDHVHYFQIDFLVLCDRYALILEVKNILGKLTFDTEMRQLIRELDDDIDVFDDPITQAEYLTGSLHQWLDERGLSLPIINRVVVASAAQIQVTNLKSDRIKKIVRRANLKAELFTIDKQFSKAHLSTDVLNKVSAALLEAHQSLIIKPFRSLIKPEAIIKGVRCPDCGAMPMRKVKQHWHCAGCDHLSKTAHLLALLDYRLIHGPAITNKQCRDFLMMTSETTVKKLLRSVASHFEGEKKARIYYLPADFCANFEKDR